MGPAGPRGQHRFPFWGSPSLRLYMGSPGDPSAPHRFPFWGSPSLRLIDQILHVRRDIESLPLLGKPFIEATTAARSPTSTP